MKPKVSFIVPCYNLAHLLTECVDSILAQTYRDFEILIMDDASPDNTADVARSFQDPRVKHIRNNPNLGHLRNYNKGIELAQGDYIWLISADDRLRKPYALNRYVDALEKYPAVGYAFCPGIGLESNVETDVLEWTTNGPKDFVRGGRVFLEHLVRSNRVLAPSGLVRRECYSKAGVFPLDLPYSGDWYLWCLFALYFDVAYFAEPMVNYRLHPISMTNLLTKKEKVKNDVAVRWRINKLAKAEGYQGVSRNCLDSLAMHYSYCLLADRYKLEDYSLTVAQYEESLHQNAETQHEIRTIRSRVNASVGDGCYLRGDFAAATESYKAALRERLWAPTVWAKYCLMNMGSAGSSIRRVLSGNGRGSISYDQKARIRT
jgi:glycosyltransferase involved in cell wall biosynthesis